MYSSTAAGTPPGEPEVFKGKRWLQDSVSTPLNELAVKMPVCVACTLWPFFAEVVGLFQPKRTSIDVVALNARVEVIICATTALHALLPIHPSISPTSSPAQSPHPVHTAG